jgi:hypothetical protein
MRRFLSLFFLLSGLAVLAGCAAPQSHSPAYTRIDGFSRQAAVATALREWRLFGSPVHDEPPGSRPPPEPDEIPSRQEGLWQRVGDYWWIGQDVGTRASLWTGRTDETGQEFPPEDADRYAWSAGFIAYLMRIAGAGDRFPYGPAHATYINAARRQAAGEETGWILVAERPEDYAPQQGDLICTGRDEAAGIGFDDLPARFPGHCDIVVAIRPGELSVIGGNVGASVAMKHVPITPEGRLASPNGIVLDDRYPWFVVLRVLYDR